MIVSAVLLAALVLGDCAGTYVYAAEGNTVQAQETEPQTESTAIPGAGGETQTGPEAEVAGLLTEEELAQYFSESVFIGDSIMVGFRNYCAKQKESFVNGAQFLAVGSYSAFNAMKPVRGDNVHPVYKGKKCQVWKALPQMGAKRVFLLLGMNDISILGLEGARDTYKELIEQILEVCPDAEIHIMSTTYTLEDAGKGKLNNENLAQYNILLQEMAQENGWGYVDVCTPLTDEDGNLDKAYCSDGFVHLLGAAYDVWADVLREYANTWQAKTSVQTAEETDAVQTVLSGDAQQHGTECGYGTTAGAGTVLQQAFADRQ